MSILTSIQILADIAVNIHINIHKDLGTYFNDSVHK